MDILDEDIGLLTGGTAKTALGMAGAVTAVGSAIVNSMIQDTTKDTGSLTANPGFLSSLTPYLSVKKKIVYGSKDGLANVKGLETYKAKTLYSFTGFVQCENVKLAEFEATDVEKEMIITLLKEGVYL